MRYIYILLIVSVIISCMDKNKMPVSSEQSTGDASLAIYVKDIAGNNYNSGLVRLTCVIRDDEVILQRSLDKNGRAVFLFGSEIYSDHDSLIMVIDISILDQFFNPVLTDSAQKELLSGEKIVMNFQVPVYVKRVYWEKPDFSQEFNLSGKKLLVIVGDDFDYFEFISIPEYLKYYGVNITRASYLLDLNAHYWERSPTGSYYKVGTSASVDTLLDDVHFSDYDCIFFPGGNGPQNLIRNYPGITSLVQKEHRDSTYIAAICHGPLVLVYSGIIVGRQIAAHSSLEATIIENGGIYVEGKVVTDGNLVTGNWPYFNSMATTIAGKLSSD